MASHTQSPSLWNSVSNLFGRLAKYYDTRTQPTPSMDDLRAEREFLNELIWSNPDAFSSELDIQNMMHLYPHRF